MVPGDELAARVESGLDRVCRHRTELAKGDIFLPAPDDLDRLANRLGETHRVMHHILLGAAATKAAAEEMLVEDDVGALDLQKPSHLAQHVGRRLGAGPDLGGFAVGTD
jgi:hypothetical protein